MLVRELINDNNIAGELLPFLMNRGLNNKANANLGRGLWEDGVILAAIGVTFEPVGIPLWVPGEDAAMMIMVGKKNIKEVNWPVSDICDEPIAYDPHCRLPTNRAHVS